MGISNTLVLLVICNLLHTLGTDIGGVSPTKTVPEVPVAENVATTSLKGADPTTKAVEIKPQKPSSMLKGDSQPAPPQPEPKAKAEPPADANASAKLEPKVETPKAPAPSVADSTGDEETRETSEQKSTILGALIGYIARFLQSDFYFLIRCGAVFTSFLTQLVPLYTIMSIRCNKTTGGQNSATYITMAFSNFLWLLYGYLADNFVIILSSGPGTCLSFIYLTIFHRYCQDYNQIRQLSACYKLFGISVAGLCILYFVMAPENLLTLVGLFGGILLAFSYLAPLLSLKEIIRSKNTSTMPTEISLAQFFGSFFMLCYGFIIWDYMVIAPNFCGMVAGMVQITLLALFPKSDRIIVYEAGILENPVNFKPTLKVDCGI